MYLRTIGSLILALVICFSMSLSIAAETRFDDLPLPLQAALTQSDDDGPPQWAYTRETHDDIGYYVERFDPSLPRDQQWQLIRFNDQAPTDKDKTRYAKRYEELFQRDDPTRVKLYNAVDKDSIEFGGEDGTRLSYTFKPPIESDEDKAVIPFLLGTLIYDNASARVLSMSMKNTQTFKPVKMVKIQKLAINMEFDVIGDEHLLALTRANSETRGRFMGLKKFSEAESVIFKNFEFKGSLE